MIIKCPTYPYVFILLMGYSCFVDVHPIKQQTNFDQTIIKLQLTFLLSMAGLAYPKV